jgi:uroporphyrinogen decarboxylase
MSKQGICKVQTSSQKDGVYTIALRDQMNESAKKLRDAYMVTPGAPFFHCEFRFYSLAKWKEQGMPQDMLPPDTDLNVFGEYYLLADLFDYDSPAHYLLHQLGWSEAAFSPAFEVKLIEDRGKYEVIQDFAGRKALYPKGHRNGMPGYLDYPVKDKKTWLENAKWRLDPKTPERYTDLAERMKQAQAAAASGMMTVQNLVGGYMYLSSLMGSERLLYAFYDMPDLIHDCMQTWLELADAVTARHQDYVTIDQLIFDEDICHKHGPFISRDMIQEFLFPYYQQLISNIKSRQIDSTRHLYIQIDSDGFAVPIISFYKEAIGMDVMGPFEVTGGCDVVEIGKQHPDLVIFGGIDNRILAENKQIIDSHVEYILPAMRERGGYIPTCGHGVLAEVPYENYLYYRKRCLELGG